MKSVSQPFEAASVQLASRNVNGLSALFSWRMPVIGLCVFVGYYLGAKVGFALTFHPYPVSVLWPPNSISGGSAFADATAHLVVHPAGGVSGALCCANTEPRSAVDDFVLVRQQLLRSGDRRGSDALPGTWTDSVHKPSQRGHFLPLCSFRRSVSVVVPGCGLCQMECLGSGHLRSACSGRDGGPPSPCASRDHERRRDRRGASAFARGEGRRDGLGVGPKRLRSARRRDEGESQRACSRERSLVRGEDRWRTRF